MKKNFLIITAFPPSRNTAGQNYTLNLISDLRHDYRIDIIYFQYKEHIAFDFHDENVKYLFMVQLNKFLKLLNYIKLPFIHPFFTARLSFKVLWYLIKNKKNYDYIYFDFSQVFIYSLFIKGIPIVLMSHDVIWQKLFREADCKKSLNLMWVKFSEGLIFKRCPKNIFTFSKKDSNILQSQYGVFSKNINFYIQKEILEVVHDFDSKYICMYGVWNRKENLESLEYFLNFIYPLLKDCVDVKIIGGGIPAEIKLVNKNSIQFLGFVENPYPILANAKALIAPIFHGAGVKVKVIEALACGTPVIGNDVALEGIEFEHKYLLAAKSPMEFKSYIEYCLKINNEDKKDLKNSFQLYYLKNHFKYYIDDLRT